MTPNKVCFDSPLEAAHWVLLNRFKKYKKRMCLLEMSLKRSFGLNSGDMIPDIPVNSCEVGLHA